jgi:hypothetical protein
VPIKYEHSTKNQEDTAKEPQVSKEPPVQRSKSLLVKELLWDKKEPQSDQRKNQKSIQHSDGL